MNPNIASLYRIASKPTRTIIGLMSGTSFDGLDIALCDFSGSGLDTKLSLRKFTTLEYEPEFKEELKAIFAKRHADLEKVTLLNAYIGRLYARLILECLEDWKIPVEEVDLVASHGQTIYHAPLHQHGQQRYGNATLQIGDADQLAVGSGIITLSDFRQKHIAAGAEGAPLAVYGDYLLFSDKEESRIMLNIGGISNFTFLPSGHSTRFFSSDVGPGNTIMDQYVQKYFPGMYYDKDAAIASTGRIDECLLRALLDHPFFEAPFPKTTGPELFGLGYLDQAMQKSGADNPAHADVLATLARFSAEGIIRAISASMQDKGNFEIYLSGGGMYNPLLVGHIENHFNRKLRYTSDLGIDPDAKEAVLFAILANEAVAGGEVNFGTHPGVPGISMGKVSFAR